MGRRRHVYMAGHCHRSVQSGIGQQMQARPTNVVAISRSQRLPHLLTIKKSTLKLEHIHGEARYSSLGVNFEKGYSLDLESWLEAKHGVL